MDVPDPYEKFYQEYKNKVNLQLGGEQQPQPLDQKGISNEYLEFKDQYLPKHFTLYEKGCNLAERIIRISPDKSKIQDIQDAVDSCHLNVTPSGVASFSLLFPLTFIFFGGMIVYALSALVFGSPSMFFLVFMLIAGAAMITPLSTLPVVLANSWRLKASNQMVLCIFYIVSYMRHTSNFEMAVKFTADHISAPLSLDLRKVLWNVETGKHESLKESFEEYLASWRKYNMEFVEAIHLVESSLYEPSEERRIEMLEKGLSLILEETYEKMLHYAHDLQSPLTMLHMLGIILPILGLVILPLVVSFMDNVHWLHIAVMYNIGIPAAVYYLGRVILSKRPTGYGETDITEKNPELLKSMKLKVQLGQKEVAIPPMAVAATVGIALIIIGFLPIIIHMADNNDPPAYDIIYTDKGRDPIITVNTFKEAREAKFAFLGYKPSKNDSTKIIGPFGLGASILSLSITLGIALWIGIYYRIMTGNLMKVREKAKSLEDEFAAALFQLGNRIGDGIPAELAFSRVASVMQGTSSGRFFELVNENITKYGFGVEKAIFDQKRGAITQFPSNEIESSMKVFCEAAKKGPKVASQALINISIYIREMHKVDERLKDLMAEIISSMKSQISFLTPAIAGIVIGITSMLTSILTKLGQQISELGEQQGTAGGLGGLGPMMDMFGDSIPTYYFQIVVGIYVIQIVFILTSLVNSIQNGVDTLSEHDMLGRTLPKSIMLYCMISFGVMLVFNLIAGMVLGGLNIA